MKRTSAPIGKGQTLCQITECPRERRSLGWCMAHYERWRLFGDPLPGIPLAPLPAGDRLCDRHLRAWRQLVIGGSDKEIAQRTGLALKTVKNALSELYGVLELNPQHTYARHSRTLATLWGMEIMRAHPEVFRDAERRKP